eukprot:16610-Heterococcus_DN1.PRE.11
MMQRMSTAMCQLTHTVLLPDQRKRSRNRTVDPQAVNTCSWSALFSLCLKVTIGQQGSLCPALQIIVHCTNSTQLGFFLDPCCCIALVQLQRAAEIKQRQLNRLAAHCSAQHHNKTKQAQF